MFLHMGHATIRRGRGGWAISSTEFFFEMSSEAATAVRVRSILMINAHSYHLTAFPPKNKRTSILCRLKHLEAHFFIESPLPSPPLSSRDTHMTSFLLSRMTTKPTNLRESIKRSCLKRKRSSSVLYTKFLFSK